MAHPYEANGDESPLLPPRGTRDEELARAAAHAASQTTLEKLFGDLGINVADFKQLQQLRDDLAWVHQIRSGSKRAGARFFMTLVMALAGAAGIAAWEFLKAMFHFHIIR